MGFNSETFTMRNPLNEARFIEVYRELTGAGEAQARSAFMFACFPEDAERDGMMENAASYRVESRWEEELSYEPAAKSRPLSRVHQLPGATRERFA